MCLQAKDMPAGRLHALLSCLLHSSPCQRQHRKAERSRLHAWAAGLVDAACQPARRQQHQQQPREAVVGRAVLAVAAVQGFSSQASLLLPDLIPVCLLPLKP